ncbi:unnamed protein product [Paramecium sonneborni]|uniref:RING-type domain-containing protein n=1 Tax=Paramecium sonneborni TaxID=65129 RepID=A0A8S1NNC9_9CILI|nr:unnamed protein product [Paramecium sonneborni]
MKIGQLVPISEQIKSKYKDLQQYSLMQYLGSYFELTLLMSILDFLLTYHIEDQLQRLVKPNGIYSKSSQIIIDKIQHCIIKERKLSLFYEQIQIEDIQYQKVKEFLQQYCYAQQQQFNFLFKEQLTTLAQIFQLSFYIFGELELKIPNKKQQCIFLYQDKNQYYYIQQYDENRNQKNQQNNCSSYKNMDQIYLSNKTQLESENDCQVSKSKLNENQFLKQDNIYINDKEIQQSQQIVQKSTEVIQMENQKYQEYSEQKLLICLKCKDKSQIQIFINKSCNHHFCFQCLSQFITDQDVNYSCLEKNCEQIIDSHSFQQFSQNLLNNNGNQITKIIVKAEFKNCSGCSKKVLRNLQFTNLCLHTFCIDCSIKFAKNTQIKIYCPYFGCLQKIAYEQLMEYLKSEKILFQCSKCEKQLERENLFLNRLCSHFLCFDCSYELVIKNSNSQLYQPCPINYCSQMLDSYQFNQFFEENQNIALQEQEKKEQLFEEIQNQESQSDIQFEGKVEKITQAENFNQSPQILNSNNNYKSQMQTDEDDDEYNNNDQTYVECTLCQTTFSDYNLRQKLNCKLHQIGVCCSLENENCPQCAKKNYYKSKYCFQSKLKLSIVNQEFDFYNFQTTSY